MDREPNSPVAGRVLVLVENLSVPRDRRVWHECETLEGAGHEVVVVSPRGETRDTAPYERLGGIEIHRFVPRPARGGLAGYALEYAWALWQTSRLTRELTRERTFDVVHVCNPPDLLFLPALPLRRRGARIVFDHHDLVPELYLSRFGRGRDPLYRLTCLLERIALGAADIVLSTNESYRDRALSRGKKRPDRVFVVRNGPKLARFRPTVPDATLRGGRAYLIAYLGVMGPQDGVDHALRALALLKRRRCDWRAVFVGDGDALPDMRRLTLALGLDSDVEFTGWLGDDDILRILSTADVCLAPDPKTPLNEISTMTKVAEYMALARPVVAYDLKETRATAGDAALYADDEAGLAANVDRLLSDPPLREAMGEVGRSRVERELAWEHSEPALLAAYELAFSLGAGGRGR